MSLKYYELLSTIITQKINQLDINNPVDFYSESDVFKLSFYLSYFLLAEEKIVSVDKDNKDIATRYILNIDESLANKLVKPGVQLYHGMQCSYNPQIIEQELEYSDAWFLSTLRNSLGHSQISDINLENNSINIDNNYQLNKLNAQIPFIWFNNFLLSNPLAQIHLGKKFSSDVFDNDHQLIRYLIKNNIKILNKKDLEIITILSNPVSIQVESDVPLEITNIMFEKYISFCSKLATRIIEKEQGEDISKIGLSIDEFKKLKKKLIQEYKSQGIKNYLYEKYLITYIFSKLLNSIIKKQYPNIIINVKVDDSFKEEDIDILIKEKKILNTNSLDKQLEIFSNFLSEKLCMDNKEYATRIRQFINNYEICSYILQNCKRYLSRKELKRIFKGNETDRKEIMDKLLEVVKEERKKKGFNDVKFDYTLYYKIEQYLYKKIENSDLDFFREDISILRKIIIEMHNDVARKKNMDFYKEKYSSFWEKYTNKLNKDGYISDEVRMHCIGNYNVNLLYKNYNELVMNKDLMLVCFLYSLGINLYVFNKESLFDEDASNYFFINSLDIVAYSTVAFNEYNGIEEKLRRIRNLKKEKIKIYNKNFANSNFPQSKLTEIKNTIDSIEKEILDLENHKKGIEIKNINNQTLATDNNNVRIASVIRHCLAHNGRIIVVDKNNDNLKIRLSNYNDTGEIAGYVEMSFDTLIDFLNNDIFYNVIHNNNQKTK